MILPIRTPFFHLVAAVLSFLFGTWSVVAEGAPSRPAPGKFTSGVAFAHSRPGSPPYPSATTKKPISGPTFGSSGCAEPKAPISFPPKGSRDVAARRSASDDPSENLGGGAQALYESSLLSSVFNRRADSTTGNLTSGNLAADEFGNLRYAVEISLGGQNYTVQLDTGSSDLWLYAAGLPVQLTNSTNLMASEAYGDVQVQGNIEFAELKIGNFTIESQAFLNATVVPAGFDSTSFDGILGMAFDVGAVYGTVQRAWGTDTADNLALSPMSALFAQDPTLPDSFDILLFRQSELDRTGEGVLMISAHAEGFESVASAPQLQRVGSEHWSIVMDAMKINGQAFSFNSSRVPGVPSGTIVAALDSGSSFPALLPAAVDAIYRNIPGAVYDETSQDWFVPCSSSANLSFVFGGQEFPVHPLDLTFPVPVTLTVNGWDTVITICINAYRYLTSEPIASDGFDIILGDEFLKNVYTSFNYADWTPTNNTGTPFVQMVSTTNTTSMWDKFRRERAATLSHLPLALDPASIVYYSSPNATNSASVSASASSTPSATPATARLSNDLSSTGDTSSNDDGASWVKQYGKVVLGLLIASFVVNIVLLVAVLLPMCMRCRRSRGGRTNLRYTQIRYNDRMEEYGRGLVMQPATETRN